MPRATADDASLLPPLPMLCERRIPLTNSRVVARMRNDFDAIWKEGARKKKKKKKLGEILLSISAFTFHFIYLFFSSYIFFQLCFTLPPAESSS